MASANEIFAALTKALQDDEDRKILQLRFKGIAVFNLEEQVWCLDVTKGKLENIRSADSAPANSNNLIQVTTTLEILKELLSQKLSPQQAFMQGKLKIKGNIGLAMKLNFVLQAIRKHLPTTPTSKL